LGRIEALLSKWIVFKVNQESGGLTGVSNR
jgi:hypothetical protein